MSGVDVKDILELDRGPDREFITKDALMNSDKKVSFISAYTVSHNMVIK